MRKEKFVVLFGAGSYGKSIVEKGGMEERFSEYLTVFCDNDIHKHNTTICGVKVISFEEMQELDKRGMIEKIVLTLALEREILYQCILAEISVSKLYYWDMDKGLEKPIWEKYTREVHSQDGEEIFLKEYFYRKDRGIYVDVGAYHPFRFSNTYWAFLKGWKGINIEPDYINYSLLKKFRQSDININCGISDEETELEYYVFKETGLNTFSSDAAFNAEDVTEVRRIAVKRMDTILEEYGIHKIDFMDIDVEGMELSVLNSINWDKVEIDCLLVEQRNMSLHNVIESEVCKLLEVKGYSPVSKYNRTVIYIRTDRKR